MARKKSSEDAVSNMLENIPDYETTIAESENSLEFSNFVPVIGFSLDKVENTLERREVEVGVYCKSATALANIPEYATSESACFDLKADFTDHEVITVYDAKNVSRSRRVQETSYVVLDPGDRAMIPTNMIFDIPAGYKLSFLPRSGLSLKCGIGLANSVATIDSDYISPSYILVQNSSREAFTINHGDRVAQGEIVPVYTAKFKVLTNPPSVKTDRIGGFGSTGVQ